MQSLFEFEDYKQFINQWIEAKGPKKRGELQRIAEALKIHPTLVSHIFRGTKDLSLEQAESMCAYLSLNQLEADYFLLLVQRAKSGSANLNRRFDRQIAEFKKKAQSLANRVIRDTAITDEERATFYSNWYYSGIRLITSIPEHKTKEAIRDYFGLPTPLVNEVLDFLVRTGLCKREGQSYSMGPAITHLEASSPWATRHHMNWRLKAIEQYPKISEQDLVFTGPLTISKEDAARFRESLIGLIQQLGKLTKDSKEEELRCFNLDWVKIHC